MHTTTLSEEAADGFNRWYNGVDQEVRRLWDSMFPAYPHGISPSMAACLKALDEYLGSLPDTRPLPEEFTRYKRVIDL